MNKTSLALVLALLLLLTVSCKQPIKRYSILIVQYTKKIPAFNQTYKGLIDGLLDKGYEQGLNLVIHYFCMEHRSKNIEYLPMEKLFHVKKDIIISLGTVPTKYILKYLPTPNPIPIVFTIVLEPKALEFNKRSKRLFNLTGLSMKIAPETQLRTIKEALPSVKRFGVFYCMDYPQAVYYAKELKDAAQKFGLEAYEVSFSRTISDNKLKKLCSSLAKKVDVISVCDPYLHMPKNIKKIVKITDKFNIPVVGISSACVHSGGLLAVYCDFYDLGYQTSDIVDKILKGHPPYMIPIEYPNSFKIKINLSKAKKLNISIPRNFLLKTDEIIY